MNSNHQERESTELAGEYKLVLVNIKGWQITRNQDKKLLPEKVFCVYASSSWDSSLDDSGSVGLHFRSCPMDLLWQLSS